ncbi:hypothetical protein BEP19_06580 [Ammoniphilus oxalaticus]|uniref:Uncharacterized protein n=1 Tax=Ammoniphilus oxalaticus TaxID=66863 RepID=A0A419SJE0_9BACL|nr:hypothetical protein [Ammoniphilus oxalaticus]RKD24070.1 hypothetical protein BEP19_06580 [Ammoniphilus oxalaticus]
MNLYDTLFNWLQLKIVADHRPNDEAANISANHMQKVLVEEHHVEITEVKQESGKYLIHYVKDGDQEIQEVQQELAEMLLQFINDAPENYDIG